jgi:hypothetical protein
VQFGSEPNQTMLKKWFLSQILYLFHLGALKEHVVLSVFAKIFVITFWKEACEDRNVINKAG